MGTRSKARSASRAETSARAVGAFGSPDSKKYYRTIEDGAYTRCELTQTARAQVEAETLMGIIIVVLFFVAASFSIFYRNNETDFVQRKTDALSECYTVAQAISRFSESHGSEEIFLQVKQDFNVGSQTIYIGEFFCPYYGTAAPATLFGGTIRIYEQGSGIVVENA